MGRGGSGTVGSMSLLVTRPQDALLAAGAQFHSVVAQVSRLQWGQPTPCRGWTVRDLIGHVVAGSHMAAAIATGTSRTAAIGMLATDFVGDDPTGATEHALELQHAAFDGDDDRVCQHPAGNMALTRLRGFRIGDLLVHQWDLAEALGIETTLDPDAVQVAWNETAPMAPIIAQLGVFGDGPSGDLDDAAPLPHRLLDLMGRRP